MSVVVRRMPTRWTSVAAGPGPGVSKPSRKEPAREIRYRAARDDLSGAEGLAACVLPQVRRLDEPCRMRWRRNGPSMGPQNYVECDVVKLAQRISILVVKVTGENRIIDDR